MTANRANSGCYVLASGATCATATAVTTLTFGTGDSQPTTCSTISVLADRVTPDAAADLPFARHVVTEDGRVRETTLALRAGDRPTLGRLFAESHASLRDDVGVSTPELEALVSALVDAGAVGSRLTGAGFGGCVVALVERRRLIQVAEAAVERYRAETGLQPEAFVCRPSAAAGPAA